MARCGGICKKQETDAQNVQVTSVRRINTDCDVLTNDAAKNAISADVIADQKGESLVPSGCKAPSCECKWDPPPPWPPNWTAISFEWEYEVKVGRLDCKYEVKGTVDIKVREIDGVCWPRLIKGKTVRH